MDQRRPALGAAKVHGLRHVPGGQATVQNLGARRPPAAPQPRDDRPQPPARGRV